MMKLESYIKNGYVEIASLPYKQNKRIVKCVKWKEEKQEELYLIEEATLLDCEECKEEATISMFFHRGDRKKYKTIRKGNKRNMSEIIVAEENVREFVKAYCYNKMSNWQALVDVCGADAIMQKVEEQEIQIDTEEGVHNLGYVYLGKPGVYLYGKKEECTLEDVKQNREWLEVLLHEMLHKLWEQETYIACESIGGNGEALGEGLTDWGVKKMQQGILEENSYWRYTVIVEVLERFFGEREVLLLSKNDRSILKKAVGDENVNRFLTCLDTHLQMHRMNEERKEVSDILTKLIVLQEDGVPLEDIQSFRVLQEKMEKNAVYKNYRQLVEGEAGTLEYNRRLHTILAHMQAETEVEEKRCLRDSIGLMTNYLFKPYFEKLQHAKQRDVKAFQILAKSVAELTIASQKEHREREEIIDISTLSKVKLLDDPLGELRENMEMLKEEWKVAILADIQKNARRPRKLQAFILEMRALMKEVKWNERDAHWYEQVVEAMGIEEEKREGMADILQMAEKEENLEAYRQYAVEYFKNGDAVFKKEGKPIAFKKEGSTTDRIKPIEQVDTIIDFTIPIGTELQTYMRNFENFKNLVMSREPELQISFINGMIVLEHVDSTYDYYTFNKQAEVVTLEKDLEKVGVRGDGKGKKTTLKEKMHQWFQKRFTSKTSVRLLAEAKKQETPQVNRTFKEQRKTFTQGISEKVEGIHQKQWEKQRKKEMEKAERRWLSGR